MHEEKGVRFFMNSEISEFIANEEGNLKEVVLSSGQRLQADLLVAGLGVVPSTDFLKDSEINLDSRGFVPVDKVMLSNDSKESVLLTYVPSLIFLKLMKTNVDDVFAAGDIAFFPIFRPKDDGNQQFASIGHWQMALHHGRTAGK